MCYLQEEEAVEPAILAYCTSEVKKNGEERIKNAGLGIAVLCTTASGLAAMLRKLRNYFLRLHFFLLHAEVLEIPIVPFKILLNIFCFDGVLYYYIYELCNLKI